MPLSDFSVRKTEAFEKGYLEGRYGAIPLITSFAAGHCSSENKSEKKDDICAITKN